MSRLYTLAAIDVALIMLAATEEQIITALRVAILVSVLILLVLVVSAVGILLIQWITQFLTEGEDNHIEHGSTNLRTESWAEHRARMSRWTENNNG